MPDNHGYNLLEQLAQEHKSLWRIKDSYLTDSASCAECTALWETLAAEKEAQVARLRKLVTQHLG